MNKTITWLHLSDWHQRGPDFNQQVMCDGFGGNRFLVTSRIVGYDRSPLTSEFKHATLVELGQPDRERFVRLWYAAIHKELGVPPPPRSIPTS
jgi:hypothetical protein